MQNSNPHHSFDTALATQYGVQEAILIHHFQHWVGVNKRLKRNFREGRTWTYQTLDEIAAHFPYMSKDQIRDTIEKLCAGKSRYSDKEPSFEPILIKGNFNKTAFDKTTWYAFKNEKMFTKWGFPQMEDLDSPNGECENPIPIPDTKPDAEKQQQQEPDPQKEIFDKEAALAAAAFSKEKDKIYDCLIPLEFSYEQKANLSKLAPEDVVILATAKFMQKKQEGYDMTNPFGLLKRFIEQKERPSMTNPTSSKENVATKPEIDVEVIEMRRYKFNEMVKRNLSSIKAKELYCVCVGNMITIQHCHFRLDSYIFNQAYPILIKQFNLT